MTLLTLALEESPRLSVESPINSRNVKTGSDFVKRISRKIINTHDPISVRASEAEVQSVMQVAHQTYSGFIGKTHFRAEGADFEISVRTSILGKQYYINAKATLTNSDKSFQWSNSKIGSLPLWDAMANRLFYRLVEAALGKNYGRKVLGGVSNINVNASEMTLTFQPPEGFQEGIAKVVERLNSYAGQDKTFNSQRIQFYIEALVDFTRSRPNKPTSLTEYLNFLLEKSDIQVKANDFNAKDENLAALYALGIQVGPGVFRHFVADLKLHRLNATPQPKLTLHSREDLAKHFVYSSALKILAEQGFSFSLGELKEILDANREGSGFSFVDITADKVGIKFTQMAIGNERHAEAIILAALEGIEEADIFPDVLSLPEGLKEEEFKEMFNDVESDAYQGLLAEIDLRINNAPLFKSLSKLNP